MQHINSEAKYATMKQVKSMIKCDEWRTNFEGDEVHPIGMGRKGADDTFVEC